MRPRPSWTIVGIVVLAVLCGTNELIWARGGFRGGGGRGGGGMRGGGGPRGGGMSRPSFGGPSINRGPSFGGRPMSGRPGMGGPAPGFSAGRPSQPPMGGAGRPGRVDFPSAGVARPGLGERPPSGQRPSTRPFPDRRSGTGERPSTQPLPDRRPGFAERPTTLPGLGNRPGLEDRPEWADRGRFENRRDWMANRTRHREDRRNDLRVRLERRDRRPDRRREDWHDWHDHYWRRHSYWHHGHWHGNYGGWWWHGLWYRYPTAAALGLTVWGVNRLCYWFGYYPYYNPYYVEPYYVSPTAVIDYSQPLVVYEQQAIASAESAPSPAEEEPSPGDSLFDEARAAFFEGRYDEALEKVDAALAQTPDDAVLHEFRALVLFATGKYRDAAAGLHAVLAVSPGWDWTTLSSLYASIDEYTQQLRALERYARENPRAAYAKFVLAYHYLTAGHTEAAADQLREVVKLEPQDQVAAQLLEMIAAPEGAGEAPPEPPLPEPEASEAESISVSDLVGTWQATGRGEARFTLTLTDDGNFSWTYRDGEPERTVEGVYVLEGNNLVLEPDAGGTLLAEVSPKDGSFHFRVIGAPEGDKGLEFRK